MHEVRRMFLLHLSLGALGTEYRAGGPSTLTTHPTPWPCPQHSAALALTCGPSSRILRCISTTSIACARSHHDKDPIFLWSLSSKRCSCIHQLISE